MALNVDIQPLKKPPCMVPSLCHHIWRKATESGKLCGILIHNMFPLIQVDELPLHLRFVVIGKNFTKKLSLNVFQQMGGVSLSILAVHQI